MSQMFKPDEGYTVSESGNWNTAKAYSDLKIMKPLYLADEYSNIAIFGHSSLLDELESPFPVEVLKIKGFYRLIHCLIQVIDNSLFAVKHESDKNKLKDYRLELKKIQEVTPALYQKINKRSGEKVQILEDKYEKVLEKVLEIKSLINIPLNKNDLIFLHKDEFDPQAYKKQIIDNATQRG